MNGCCVPALAEENSLPDMELLEFLAEWEMPDGQWVDPVELDSPVTAARETTVPEMEVPRE